ncbi:MAG: tRNA pseudouridine(55) synthase TruB [Sphingomonadaceae bacterium]
MNGTKKAAPEGFLNVSKPYGWTSHDVVQLVRRLTRTRRVGHAGTLDPAATGVLVVAVGRATRLVDYLGEQDKSYCGDVVLGATTTTDDAEGSVLGARDPSTVTLDQVTRALSGFVGEIDQLPPQYSAVKLEGKKAYEIARKGGLAAVRPRRVTIKGIAVVAWEPPIVSLMVRCSKGTYIRSLARDLGQRLGVGGHLGALVRVSSGVFDCEDAIGVEDLRLAAEFDYLEKLIWPPDVAVAHLPALVVAERHAEDMMGGRSWAATSPPQGTKSVRVYTTEGVFLGLAELREMRWWPKLVLLPEEQ